MNATMVIDAITRESEVLNDCVRNHSQLSRFFGNTHSGSIAEKRDAYIRYLKLTADYVACTVPMLRAAGEALANGSGGDKEWSSILLSYAADEIDPIENYGHNFWATNDMRALGASDDEVNETCADFILSYKRYFVENAGQHPYAILGAKGVLEHLAIVLCDDLVGGIRASSIPNASNAVSFFSQHGMLDIDHVIEGDNNLRRITSGVNLDQVLAGAYFTGGSYRSFLRLI